MKSKTLRVVIPVAVVALFAVAYIANLDFGTLSSFGWSTISLLCPLGALMAMLAAKLMVPRALIALVIAIGLMIIFGRAFCAWVCPVPVLQKLKGLVARITIEGITSDGSSSKAFQKGKKKDKQLVGETETDFDKALSVQDSKELKANSCATCAQKRGTVIDSRHIILGGSVLSALIFGFPVFCLVCPIGLTFGTVFLLINLFGYGDVTWAVVVVPLLLVVEVVFFKKWCGKFCPLSAFMSLSGKLGRFFRPKINDQMCQETAEGKPCGICAEVCPEMIDPRHPDTSISAISECTKCLVCVENCPTQAIKLPVWSSKEALVQKTEDK
jgi:ferredoxin-type protein NapH